jgi:Spx/MgsR family transcriptional regulator
MGCIVTPKRCVFGLKDNPHMIILHGIPHCDTVKKARAWLTERGVEYVFHDFKRHGVPEQALDQWLATLDWTVLVNRKGTTWRQLDEATRAAVVDAPSARALMMTHASVIKRPVVQWPNGLSVGFDAEEWNRRLPA